MPFSVRPSTWVKNHRLFSGSGREQLGVAEMSDVVQQAASRASYRASSAWPAG